MNINHLKANPRITEIDGLRGIAAISVLIFHFTNAIQIPILYPVFKYGYMGVHLFFIISGFVIFMSVERSDNLKQFIKSRFIRLYPLYWLAIGVSVVITTLAFTFNFIGPFPVNGVSLGQLNANLTMFQHWMGVRDINGVFWTLIVELNFYILIGILIKTKKISNIILWCYGFLFIEFIYVLTRDTNLLFYLPLIQYGHIFIVGIVFYNFYKRKQFLLSELILIICALIFHFLIFKPEEALIFIFMVGIFYFVVSRRLKILSLKPLVYLGSISYFLYLVHESLAYMIFNFLDKIGITGNYTRIAIALMCIFGLVVFVTKYVEKPLNLSVKKLLSNL